jgi:hemoglobin
LARFLCGWLGGPHRYQERYGPISIPGVHGHLAIGEAERDAWLALMREAIAAQPYADDFKHYLLTQLAVPAERIRQVCAMRGAG